jgi:uncharacterized membrane protein YbhN (UPF0104 family)
MNMMFRSMNNLQTVLAMLKSCWEAITNIVNSRYFLVFKWLIFLIAIGFLLKSLSYDQLQASLSLISPTTLLLFLAIVFTSRVIYVFRWWLICRHIVTLPATNYRYLLRISFLGEFSSIIFCTAGAGEIVRVSKLSNFTGNLSYSALSVALDRLFGVGGMLLFALLFLPYLNISFDDFMPVLNNVNWLMIILVATVCILGIGFILQKGLDMLKKYNLNFSFLILFNLLLFTLAGHLLFASGYYFLLQKVHPTPYLISVALVFVSQLAKAVPVSLLGISGGEASLLVLASLVGISTEEIIAVIGVAVASLYFISSTGLLAELFVDGKAFILSNLEKWLR